MNNINSPTAPHHTRLYVALGLLIVFATLFFLVKYMTMPEDKIPEVYSPPDPTKVLILTPEQASLKEKNLADPRLSEQSDLTQTEAAAKKKILLDPSLEKRNNQ